MKLDTRLLARQIARVKAQIANSEQLEELVRLTNLLVMMQSEYIYELEKRIAKEALKKELEKLRLAKLKVIDNPKRKAT